MNNSSVTTKTNVYFVKNLRYGGLTQKANSQLKDVISKMVDGSQVYLSGQVFLDPASAKEFLGAHSNLKFIIFNTPTLNKPKDHHIFKKLGDEFHNLEILESNYHPLTENLVLTTHFTLNPNIKQITFSDYVPDVYKERAISLNSENWKTVPTLDACDSYFKILEERNN